MSMKAVAHTAYGGPDVTKLLDLPKPEPGPSEVLVRTAAGAFNPLDIIQRDGGIKMVFPQSFPLIAGSDLSGVVEAVGADVTRFKVGDAVIARVVKTKLDAFAEYSTQDESVVSHAPKSMSLSEAAGLPLAGLTSEQILDELDVKPGDRVLVTGGAGGVGLFGIQLAKVRGATVVTTASPAGEQLVREAGADEVINYRTTKLSSLPTKFNKVFDAAGFQDGNEAMEDLFGCVEKGGKIVSIAGVPLPGQFDQYLPWWKCWAVNWVLSSRSAKARAAADRLGITYKYLFMSPDGIMLQKLADLVDAGKLKVYVDSRFPMAQFADGFARLESHRAKGKIILEIGGDKVGQTDRVAT